MPSGAANLALQNQLNTLTEIGVVGNVSDGSLLEQIVRGPDGVARAAFTVLVERHGPMVLGVCSQALANPHDVEDAFQATFLVLAQKAASVRKADSVASWLHGVALRVAARARNEVVRRSKFERRSAEMKSKQFECGESRPDVWPELHEEIASLPKHFRDPVVLCYLEGLSAELAAHRLGCPRGTILSRLARARERLRRRLIRRGFASPEAFVLVQIFPAAPALPTALLDTTVRESLSIVARSSTAMTLGSTAPAVLARGVIYAMMITRLKISTVAALGACLIAIGAGTILARQDQALGVPPKTSQKKEASESNTHELIPFQKVALSTDDLVEATGLDIYKFQINLRKNERFRVELRVIQSKESPSRELVSHTFRQTEEKPTTIRVSFLRRDKKMSGFLLTDEAEAEFRLICSGGASGGIVTIVKNPLGQLDPTRRGLLIAESDKHYPTRDEKETVLIRICKNNATKGVDVDGYPRGEVVVVREQKY